jgi:2-hydroxymuconate-semialdehyde hydrolase
MMTASSARERMLAGLPRPRTVDVAGTSTAVIEVGDGPPLLLLHGAIECGGAMWAPVLPRLAPRHRVVVPDVPGLGESAPMDNLDVDSFSRWLAGLVERTGLEDPTVVAHSLIGSLTARLATRDTGLIGRLVVYAAPAVGPYRMPLGLRYAAVRFAVRPTERNAERLERFALLDLDATRQRDRDWFEAFDAYTRARARQAHVGKTMRKLVATQTKPIPDSALDLIDVPTTLLWGRHDRMVSLAVGQSAAAHHGWPLRVIDDAGHAPHIERPDAFVETLTAVTAPTGLD